MTGYDVIHLHLSSYAGRLRYVQRVLENECTPPDGKMPVMWSPPAVHNALQVVKEMCHACEIAQFEPGRFAYLERTAPEARVGPDWPRERDSEWYGDEQ